MFRATVSPTLPAARRHWPIALLALVASSLLLVNLGGDYLWEDEGDTAVLAHSIVQQGVPNAWDGVTFVAPDFGERLTGNFLMVSHPWLQYYAAAGSFALFGESPWSARLPFALAGLLTILVVYALVTSLLRSRLAALSAAVLLTLSVQFLLFARQARNYPFNALLTCLLVWQFLRLRSWRHAVLFAATGILLFHAHAIGLAAMAALALLTLVHRPFAPLRRWAVPAAIVVGLYALPWVIASQAGYREAMDTTPNAPQLLPQLLQFAVECLSVTPLAGAAVLGAFVRRRQGRLASEEHALVAACVAVMAAEALVVAATQSRDVIWIVGLHHTPAIIPLAMIVTGILLARASRRSRAAWVALMLIFGVTRFAQVVPWTLRAERRVTRNPDTLVTFHVPNRLVDALLRTGQVQFVRSLAAPNPGVVAHINEFLRANASPGDVIVTNYAWEPIYFHSRLPQGAKIAPSFPIYRHARAHHLPEYVFSAAGARWIIWRRAWPAYFKEQDAARALQDSVNAGRVPRLVARIRETMYENRENIHFRRFAGDRYIFPSYGKLPDVLIYKVETNAEAAAYYRSVLARRPDDVEALKHLGVALVATDRFDEARPVFTRAARLAPGDAWLQLTLANSQLDGGEFVSALASAQRAVELAPGDADAHDVLGRALAMNGRMRGAVREFERALGIDPANAAAKEHLARVRALDGP